jgi:GNAT superfamily N-acetyltransferase
VTLILLARLAVSQGWHGQGVGSGLLKDAMLRTTQAAEIGGIWALAAHAKNDTACAFYEHFGFMPSPTDPPSPLCPSQRSATDDRSMRLWGLIDGQIF